MSRVNSKYCIVCDEQADFYCARCGVAPYCTDRCQRRDWSARHKAVCHNLARLSGGASKGGSEPVKADDAQPFISPPAALRRPRSPPAKRDPPKPRDETMDMSHKNSPRFVPPGHNPPSGRQPQPNNQDNRQNNRPYNRQDNVQDNRRPQREDKNSFDEEWGTGEKKVPITKPVPKEVEPFSLPKPVPKTLERKTESFKSDSPTMDRVDTKTPMEGVVPKAAKQEVQKVAKQEIVAQKVDVVPAEYLIGKLPVGDTFVLSVESAASECDTKQPGFVCLAMHAQYENDYNKLIGEFGEMCEQLPQPINPAPGASYAYLDPADGGWYRARCLSAAHCALLDAGRCAALAPGARLVALPEQYARVPEFCCVLNAPVEVGTQLKCVILSKSADGVKVSLEAAESDAPAGRGEVTRWLPIVKYPQPTPVKTVQSQSQPVQSQPIQPAEPQTIQPTQPQPIQPTQPQPIQPKIQPPEVPRPPVANNARYILLDATSFKRVCVRPCDAQVATAFESVLHDAVLYGMKASPLKEPPLMGQTVVAAFQDLGHYRALVRRTNVKQNKYLIEYVEYGNEEITQLEKLYPCPPELELSSKPATASIVQLSSLETSFTEPATAYIENLKDNSIELVATIPTGDRTAPSGSLINLAVAQNKESVNRKLEEMCTPEWKKLEERGGDVIESARLMFSTLQYLPLPSRRPFALQVIDFSSLQAGSVSGYETGEKMPQFIYGQLTERMNEYCNSQLCKDPYLPVFEELCITKFPPYPQWFRAVLLEQIDGAGGAEARVLYIDYGNVGVVPVADIRKMLPEFVRDAPALANHVDIKNFPENPSAEQLTRALTFMKVTDEGQGELYVTSCRKEDMDAMYEIEAPELIAYMNAA